MILFKDKFVQILSIFLNQFILNPCSKSLQSEAQVSHLMRSRNVFTFAKMQKIRVSKFHNG